MLERQQLRPSGSISHCPLVFLDMVPVFRAILIDCREFSPFPGGPRLHVVLFAGFPAYVYFLQVGSFLS